MYVMNTIKKCSIMSFVGFTLQVHVRLVLCARLSHHYIITVSVLLLIVVIVFVIVIFYPFTVIMRLQFVNLPVQHTVLKTN